MQTSCSFRTKLKQLETLEDSEISEDFVKEVQGFLKFVYAHCPVKKLETGQTINGASKSFLLFSNYRNHTKMNDKTSLS